MSGTGLEALLDEWCAKAGVTTVLERIYGSGDRSPACGALLTRGKQIVLVVDDAAGVERGRRAYGGEASVRVDDGGELPKSDLVLIHGDRPAGEWRGVITRVAKAATKVVIVAVENAAAWPVMARSVPSRWLGRDRARRGQAWGSTAAMAPVLWSIGRVREHVYLDAPSFASRAPQLVSRVAPVHAFVVDVAPRTPQARRRVRLQTA